MKYLILILAIIGFSVQADPQLDGENNNCHFPQWINDTDDEHKVTGVVRLEEKAGQGAVAGVCIVEQKNIPLVDRIEPAVTGNEATTRPGNYHLVDDGQTTCKLINNDGTAYDVAEWIVFFETICSGNPSFCDVTYRVFCGYDNQQLIDAYNGVRN